MGQPVCAVGILAVVVKHSPGVSAASSWMTMRVLMSLNTSWCSLALLSVVPFVARGEDAPTSQTGNVQVEPRTSRDESASAVGGELRLGTDTNPDLLT